MVALAVLVAVLQAPDLGHGWPRRPVGVAEAHVPRRDSGPKPQTQLQASVDHQLTSGLLRDPGDDGVTEQIGFKDPRNGDDEHRDDDHRDCCTEDILRARLVPQPADGGSLSARACPASGLSATQPMKI